MMKTLFITYIFYICNVIGADYKFMPNLPAGEYLIKFKGIIQCPPSKDYIIFHNLYLSKKSATVTMIKGNLTILKPSDDTYSLEVNMAIKDSIGGWKDNAYVYKNSKSCSTFQKIAGDEVLHYFTRKNVTCPIPPGVYMVDFDSAIINNSNLPKTFFYGSYKFRLYYTKNKKIYGCIIFIVDVVRPWE